MLDPEPGPEVQAPPEALDLREAGPAQELLVLLRGDGDEDALEAESLPLDRLLAVAIRPLEPVVEVRHQRIGPRRRANDLLDEDEGPTRCGVFVHVAEHAGAKLDGDELQGQDSQGERRLDVRVAGAKVEVQQRHSPVGDLGSESVTTGVEHRWRDLDADVRRPITELRDERRERATATAAE